MLFNLESDSGDRVVWYIVPDSFGGEARAIICQDETPILSLKANEDRPAVVVAGRHETGRCGFSIDESQLPGLREITNLAIFEEESGLLVYRRPSSQYIEKKIVRLESHLYPLWRLDDALKRRFQHHFRGAEAFGRETVTQLLLLDQIASSYLSGRILYRNYAYFIEAGFDVYTILQDPYLELAERLLVLSRVRQAGLQLLGERDAMVFEPAINFAANLPFDDDKALKRAFKGIPSDAAQRLANPLVRQLTTSTPDEMPPGGAIASALDALSSFKLIGFRHEPEIAQTALREWLDLEAEAIPLVQGFRLTSSVARVLRESRSLDGLIELDLEVYHHLAEASRLVTDASA